MNTDTWIIEYRSPTFKSSIFFVWYTDTDENSTDRFLTFKTGEIFSTTSLTDIKSSVIANFGEINEFDNLSHWLNDFDDSAPPPTIYDLDSAFQCILSKDLNIETIECLANFVNLFGDYVHQDERNKHLQIYSDNEFIREVWEYYYNFIFWPRFNDSEKFKTWDRPPLVIDTIKLMDGLEQLIKRFEAVIRVTR
jgi:hypothetical protein